MQYFCMSPLRFASHMLPAREQTHVILANYAEEQTFCPCTFLSHEYAERPLLNSNTRGLLFECFTCNRMPLLAALTCRFSSANQPLITVRKHTCKDKILWVSLSVSLCLALLHSFSHARAHTQALSLPLLLSPPLSLSPHSLVLFSPSLSVFPSLSFSLSLSLCLRHPVARHTLQMPSMSKKTIQKTQQVRFAYSNHSENSYKKRYSAKTAGPRRNIALLHLYIYIYIYIQDFCTYSNSSENSVFGDDCKEWRRGDRHITVPVISRQQATMFPQTSHAILGSFAAHALRMKKTHCIALTVQVDVSLLPCRWCRTESREGGNRETIMVGSKTFFGFSLKE